MTSRYNGKHNELTKTVEGQDMENTQKCISCKFYIEHYVISGKVLRPIGGHCSNNDLKKSRNVNKFALQENCDKWEDNSSVKKERHRSINETIEFMSERLNQLVEILEIERGAPTPIDIETLEE